MHRPTLPKDKREVYLIGQKALAEELEELGLTYHGGLVCDAALLTHIASS
jgi:hypothetical protein